MKVRVSSDAQKDLIEIWRYSSRNWGPERADRYLDGIGARFNWLAHHPALWRPRSELGRGVMSWPHERHVVFFRNDENALDILRVLHQGMDPDKAISRDT